MAVLSLTWKSPYVDKAVFILRRGPGGLYNTGYLLKLKCVEILFAHKLFPNYPISLKFWIAHGSITGILHAKFQNDLATKMDVMYERGFVRFKFKMSFIVLQQTSGLK